MGKLTRKSPLLISLLAFFIAGTGWYWFGIHHHTEDTTADAVTELTTHHHEQVYVCPMHPQVRQSSPGRCPICGMDLVAVEDQPPTETETKITTVVTAPPPNAQIATVELRPLSAHINTWARVAVDGSNEVLVTAPADGWIRRLTVQHAGQIVMQGDVLFDIFSPELYQRQRDYIDILNRRDQLEKTLTGGMGGQNGEMLGSLARERKRQRDAFFRLGISQASIDLIDEFHRPLETFSIVAPVAGQIISVDARQGLAAGPATTLYRIAKNDVVPLDIILTPTQLAQLASPAQLLFASSNDVVAENIDISQAVYDEALQSYKLRVSLNHSALEKIKSLSSHDQKNIVPAGTVWDVVLATAPRDILTVPREAVLENPDGQYVVVEASLQHYAVKKIVTAGRDAHWIGIREGLNAGDKVVTEGQFLLDAAATFQQSFNTPAAD